MLGETPKISVMFWTSWKTGVSLYLLLIAPLVDRFTTSPALQRRSDLCIPRNETSRRHFQFSYSCICERFIYCHHRSAYFAIFMGIYNYKNNNNGQYRLPNKLHNLFLIFYYLQRPKSGQNGSCPTCPSFNTGLPNLMYGVCTCFSRYRTFKTNDLFTHPKFKQTFTQIQVKIMASSHKPH